MHPVAKKCVRWSIALFVAGAVLVVVIPRTFVGIVTGIGGSSDLAVDLVDVTLTLVRWTTLPVGASLIGAAVVVNTLAPRGRRPTVDDHHLRNVNTD